MNKLTVFAAAMAAMVPFAASAPAAAEARHSVHRDRDRDHNRQEARHHRRGWRAYAAPVRHWRYRPVTVGFRLQPAYYGSRYSIGNYGAYRLRAPGRYQRWIRYGDDLLLVNVRTGRVLRVVNNRYW